MKILINRTDAIGDTLLSMPVAQLIKEKYPHARIAFIISPICKDLFINHPYVDEVFVFDKKAKLVKKYHDLKNIFKSFLPDHYIYMGGSHLVSAYAYYKKVSFRGGLLSRFSSFLFLNKGVRQKRSMVSMHETDYNFLLLEPLGISYPEKIRHEYPPIINLSHEERIREKKYFDELLIENNFETHKPLIFVHPGMTGHTLNWSSRNYARLIKRLDERFPNRFLFILSHTPSDGPFLVGFRNYLKESRNEAILNKIFFYNGAIRGLRAYMSVLSYAKLFVGPSTGTLHIANTIDIPCVGIYSPIRVQSSLRWGPFKRREEDKTAIIVPDVVCGESTNCIESDCPYYLCMDKIEVEDVICKILPLLEKE